jgi:hypothetical protein
LLLLLLLLLEGTPGMWLRRCVEGLLEIRDNGLSLLLFEAEVVDETLEVGDNGRWSV